MPDWQLWLPPALTKPRFRLYVAGHSVSVIGGWIQQVALSWLVDRPAVTSVILGARSLEQLKDNLAAADMRLDADETAVLDAASDPTPADYPYGGPGNEQRSRLISGGR